ncbi:MAG: manganese efflux pump [Oscillospiraceae bacterium]|jgi:putative sporulation protein YtaF|nr:manganese efflux pump [Oscillospiraceae bacterium]
MFFSIPEAVLLASSCSLDAFSASFAYGAKGIRIPLLSAQILNVVCSAVLGLSLWAGAAARGFLPEWLAAGLAFGILFLLGLSKLLDGILKTVIRRYTRRNGKNPRLRFALFDVRFILSMAADPEEADANRNKIISAGEAVALAVSLSLDGVAVGFGAAVGNVNIPAVFLLSLVTDTLAVLLGSRLGHRLARGLPFNVSWLGGAILIGLAVCKLF